MSLATEEAPLTRPVPGAVTAALPIYALTLFLSAFLLFSVQPFFAKMTLPRLGGSPAVWSVAMVFFQGMLLAGYAYAHLLTRSLSLRAAAAIHAAVLLVAFVALPIAIPAGWEQPPVTGQAVWLLGLFAVAVGLPFFAVAANGPLLQAWFARTGHPLAFFFAAALHCHAMLFAIRPEAGRLTGFYLWMSLGGVLGGAFASLAAPVLFDWVGEYVLLVVAAMAVRPGLSITRQTAAGLVAAAIATVAALLALQASGLVAVEQLAPTIAMLLIGLVLIAPLAQLFSPRIYLLALATLVPAAFVHANASPDLFRERSFFGIVRVTEALDGRYHRMMHGSTLHGAMEVVGPDGQPVTGLPVPRTYYHESGGMAAALRAMQERRGGSAGRVGAVGLGSGSIVCHRAPDERWTFYEIDRIVVDAARDPKLFRFMPECGADVPVVIGDARLTLASEPDDTFDFLLIDAFSSDSIPAHLMTREAVELYRSKLKPDGMLVFHISNCYLELQSVLAAIAEEEGLEIRSALTVASEEDRDERFIFSNRVVVMASAPEMFGKLNEDPRWVTPEAAGTRPWTDDFSNIFTALLRKL